MTVISSKPELERQPGRYRAGLSLLELLVVLTILIALGGIVVATLPGVLRRTETATAAANVSQIDATIRQSVLINQGRVGNRLDALIVGGTSLDGEVAPFLGGADQFATISLTAADVTALQRIGISELVPALNNPDNATFNSHQQAPVKLAADANVCTLSGLGPNSDLARHWNITPDAKSRFMVVGLGGQSSLVGVGADALFPEAPLHFSDNHLANPQLMYSRYLLVIQLITQGDKQVEARYVGTCIPTIDGPRTVGQALEEHYSGSS